MQRVSPDTIASYSSLLRANEKPDRLKEVYWKLDNYRLL